MASTSARSGDKKDIRSSQAAASLGGGQKLSCSEEFLTRISTELTDEALFIARSRLSPLPNKEKNTKDQGTQISRHGTPLSLPALATTLLNMGKVVPLTGASNSSVLH